ncbi:hypothetical protein TWF281_004185 [Arthrobotrys megalospora]
MSSLYTLPTEIYITILSLLPPQDQLSALQVCTLWRSCLLTPEIEKSRYSILGYGEEAPRSPVYRLIPIANANKGDNNTDERPLALVEKTTFLVANIDPSGRKISTYEMWIQKCSPVQRPWKELTINDFHVTNLPSSHPFLNELAVSFSPLQSSSLLPDGTSTAPDQSSNVLEFETIYVAHFPHCSLDDRIVPKATNRGFSGDPTNPYPQCATPDTDSPPVFVYPSSTVQQVVAQAWSQLRDILDSTGNRGIERVHHVRVFMGEGMGTGIPTIMLELHVEGFCCSEVQQAKADTGGAHKKGLFSWWWN